MSDEMMTRLDELSALLRAAGLDQLADALEAGEDIEEALVGCLPREVRL
jgi:hypothetical protein